MGTNSLKDIGAVNDVKGAWKLKSYQTWFAILKRTHQQHYALSEPRYAATKLHPEWYTLSNYMQWYDTHNPDKSLAVDKDLMGLDTYGPDTCVTITQNLNNALQITGNNNGYPTGVKLTPSGTYSATLRKYYATSSKNFAEEKLAANWYKSEKAKYLIELALAEPNPLVPKLVDAFIAKHLSQT